MILIIISIVTGLAVSRNIGFFSLLFLSIIFLIVGLIGQPLQNVTSFFWGLLPMIMFQVAVFAGLLGKMFFHSRVSNFWNERIHSGRQRSEIPKK